MSYNTPACIFPFKHSVTTKQSTPIHCCHEPYHFFAMISSIPEKTKIAEAESQKETRILRFTWIASMLGHALRDMYNVQVGLKNRWPEKQKRFATEEMQSHNSSPYPCFKRRYVGAGAHQKSSQKSRAPFDVAAIK